MKNSNGCSDTCTFCGALFATTNMMKMQMHLAGDTGQSTRVAPCPKNPGACRQFNLDKTASEPFSFAENSAKEKRDTRHLSLIHSAMD